MRLSTAREGLPQGERDIIINTLNNYLGADTICSRTLPVDGMAMLKHVSTLSILFFKHLFFPSMLHLPQCR